MSLGRTQPAEVKPPCKPQFPVSLFPGDTATQGYLSGKGSIANRPFPCMVICVSPTLCETQRRLWACACLECAEVCGRFEWLAWSLASWPGRADTAGDLRGSPTRSLFARRPHCSRKQATYSPVLGVRDVIVEKL